MNRLPIRARVTAALALAMAAVLAASGLFLLARCAYFCRICSGVRLRQMLLHSG